MRILHLAPDEKFISFTFRLFNELPDVENRLVIRSLGRDRTLRHTSSLAAWRVVSRDYFVSSAMAEDLRWCDCLVVHYLEPLAATMILRAPGDVVKVWSAWGADYHQLIPESGRPILGPQTQALVTKLRQASTGRWLRSLYSRARNQLIGFPLMRAAALRADLYSAPILEEFEDLRTALGPRFRARFAQLNYGDVESIFSEGASSPAGEDILVGNSAAATNNHAEAFSTLARLDLGDRRIVVPLAYGDSDYRSAVIALGRRMFGARFVPVTEFLPLADYNSLIGRCAIAIMNHRRQQALGNIGTLMERGARIVLDEHGTLFRFFTSLGTSVDSLQALERVGAMLPPPLSEAERLRNRAALRKVWSAATVRRNATDFVSALERCRITKNPRRH